ncbi:succinyldiaminopimelate transaminase [Thioalkalicoccus limnaeus]|uniref:Succinyldiaminopimelate transaminase n=1 Tax=Thioalkalicoccus limnaeus TaxID=120681 RepID=A0ABV4B999_9GAMM
MNSDLVHLQPYPFERLATLKRGLLPPADKAHIALSIGEPKHPTPALIRQALADRLDKLSVYPTTRGLVELREAIATWLTRRYGLDRTPIDAETQVLPVNGTREALFAFAQAIVDRGSSPLVLMPNPFYQIYEGAAWLAGAEPHYLPCRAENGYIPDFAAVAEATWKRCQLLYLCSPGNPTGAVVDRATLEQLVLLAQRHDFVIASDECYAEIYLDESRPPTGLLEAAAAVGIDDFSRCVVFHSLSKRSNAPGLRSGFVAGDAQILARFLTYRTYHGCAMPLQHQYASIAAWNDEQHVIINRRLYREKFAAVLDALGGSLDVTAPAAGFYLWPKTPIPDTDFARGLFAHQHVTVLPGSFLSRAIGGHDPGSGRMRLALVATLDECVEGAHRIRDHVESI